MSSSAAGSRTLPFSHRRTLQWRPALAAVVKRSAANVTLKRLVEMPLTILGAGCFSTAAFIGNEIAGFAVTGVCLIVLELMISDYDTSDMPRSEYLE